MLMAKSECETCGQARTLMVTGYGGEILCPLCFEATDPPLAKPPPPKKDRAARQPPARRACSITTQGVDGFLWVVWPALRHWDPPLAHGVAATKAEALEAARAAAAPAEAVIVRSSRALRAALRGFKRGRPPRKGAMTDSELRRRARERRRRERAAKKKALEEAAEERRRRKREEERARRRAEIEASLAKARARRAAAAEGRCWACQQEAAFLVGGHRGLGGVCAACREAEEREAG